MLRPADVGPNCAMQLKAFGPLSAWHGLRLLNADVLLSKARYEIGARGLHRRGLKAAPCVAAAAAAAANGAAVCSLSWAALCLTPCPDDVPLPSWVVSICGREHTGHWPLAAGWGMYVACDTIEGKAVEGLAAVL